MSKGPKLAISVTPLFPVIEKKSKEAALVAAPVPLAFGPTNAVSRLFNMSAASLNCFSVTLMLETVPGRFVTMMLEGLGEADADIEPGGLIARNRDDSGIAVGPGAAAQGWRAGRFVDANGHCAEAVIKGVCTVVVGRGNGVIAFG